MRMGFSPAGFSSGISVTRHSVVVISEATCPTQSYFEDFESAGDVSEREQTLGLAPMQRQQERISPPSLGPELDVVGRPWGCSGARGSQAQPGLREAL